MNNNTNVIWEAIGELDNEILDNAFKKKKKKPIALLVIAGAAALSLLIGAIHVQEYTFHVNANHEWLFDIVTKPHFEAVLLSVEELTEMGVTDIKYDAPHNYKFGDDSKNYTYFISAKPSEIIKKYNLKPLINDNFLEEVTIDDFPEGMEPHTITKFLLDEDYDKLLPGTRVRVSSQDFFDSVEFSYFMIDKQSGIPVYVRSNYDINHRFNQDLGGWCHFANRDYRIVDLNNGEKAIVVNDFLYGKTSIIFGYDNVFYEMFTEAGIDETVQILKNLGITAE